MVVISRVQNHITNEQQRFNISYLVAIVFALCRNRIVIGCFK